MLRRPPGEGGPPRKLFLAWAALFLAPYMTIAAESSAGSHIDGQVVHSRDDGLDEALRKWDDAHSQDPIPHGSVKTYPRINTPSNDHDQKHNKKNLIPNPNPANDASALATTLAPAQPVRAPASGLRPNAFSAAGSGTGLASPQNARSLADWEVEDYVLLATVDGDLYASDRATAQKRWHLFSEQPMIETIHHRGNSSTEDEDFLPVDHNIFAIEPTRDGVIYNWQPDASGKTHLVNTGLTMKRLVEDLSPYASQDPPVAYVGEKRTSIYTLDAATGNILQFFGPGGSQTNDAASCLRPTNAIYDQEECASIGTITLGRAEYTVSVQRRDGKPLATLKYAEWNLNTFDTDLRRQYKMPLDQWYLTSLHDGSVVGVSDEISEGSEFRKMKLKTQYPSPVAKVFDVCRARDTNNPNPELVALPQPPPPAEDEIAQAERENVVFLDHTEDGSWYALSGHSYPMVVEAPPAMIEHPALRDICQRKTFATQAETARCLTGTHHLDLVDRTYYRPPMLPAGEDPQLPPPSEDNATVVPDLTESLPPTIVEKMKSIPEIALDRAIAFVTNEVFIVLLGIFIVLYHKQVLSHSKRLVRQWSRRQPSNGKSALESDVESETDEKPNSAPEVPEPRQEVAEKARAMPETAAEVAPAPERSASPARSDDASNDDSDKENRVKFADLPGVESDRSPTPRPPQVTQSSSDQAADAGFDAQGQTQGQGPGQKKKKAHRGRRGGVKHRKGGGAGPKREMSESRDDERVGRTVEDALNKLDKVGAPPKLEPDVKTVSDDMQSVNNPILKMDNFVVNTEDQLGTGSNGTLVFSGTFDGRAVAVKRMLIQFYDIASQETRLLRESDDHPNVIRYYAQLQRDGFLYIALERCAASLADVVEKPQLFPEIATAGKKDIPGVLLQITNGISHLHNLRIVHRDLKPQNILVNMGKDGRPRLLVSDFGLCKKLEGGQSSFGATTGRAAGTSGWRAPELLLDDDAGSGGGGMVDASTHSGSGSVLVSNELMGGKRATRSIDIFSLGLVFFYVLTNGSHPFDCGDRYMREVNIRKGNYSLRPLEVLGDFAYEAKDIIASMLHQNPKLRPTARDVMAHPFFWPAKDRLQFLCDVSDHFEKEPRDPPSHALMALERHAGEVTKGDFLRFLPREFIDSLGKQRKYTGSRMLDLLRALRNKKNHYEDMPDSLKRQIGPLPEGYLSFWTVKFPELLLVCWNVVYEVGWDSEDRFRDYYEPRKPPPI